MKPTSLCNATSSLTTHHSVDPTAAVKEADDRIGSVKQVMNETNVEVELNLDGVLAFLFLIIYRNHCNNSVFSHGLFDVHVKAVGDIHIDDHHTNEAVALAIGMALLNALGDRKEINRFDCLEDIDMEMERYKVAKREAKIAVARAKDKTYEDLEDDIKKWWGEYFSSLFNETPSDESRPGGGEDVGCTPHMHYYDCYYSRIILGEVRAAFQKMGRNKAVGPDQIPIEAWKGLKEEGVKWLTHLFNKIFPSTKMPDEWRLSEEALDEELSIEKVRGRLPRSGYWFRGPDSSIQEDNRVSIFRVQTIRPDMLYVSECWQIITKSKRTGCECGRGELRMLGGLEYTTYGRIKDTAGVSAVATLLLDLCPAFLPFSSLRECSPPPQ
ncbi:retrovirus-related pol polyprotein LINE-1 [Tanacetum coccineum]